FELPGRTAGEQCREAELLDEHDGVAIGIIEHDCHRLTAAQHVIAALAAPLAGKQAVPEPEGIDPQMSCTNRRRFSNLDIGMRRRRLGHTVRPSTTVSAEPLSISTTQRSGSRRRWRSIYASAS